MNRVLFRFRPYTYTHAYEQRGNETSSPVLPVKRRIVRPKLRCVRTFCGWGRKGLWPSAPLRVSDPPCLLISTIHSGLLRPFELFHVLQARATLEFAPTSSYHSVDRFYLSWLGYSVTRSAFLPSSVLFPLWLVLPSIIPFPLYIFCRVFSASTLLISSEHFHFPFTYSLSIGRIVGRKSSNKAG